MNSLIIQYFNTVEEMLLESPFVIRYKIIRKEIGLTNAPHHKHNSDESVHGVKDILDISDIFEEIEKNYV